ncbi:hypothetical protein FRC17_009092 [Serendipita sp. 399]|nr:hypothetical protein FRC17_009092 [Serendipita sp. 399]
MDDARRASFEATIASLRGTALKSRISDAEFREDANLCIAKSNQEITDWWKFTGGSLSTMKRARIFAAVGVDVAGGILNEEYQQRDVIALTSDVRQVRKDIGDLQRNFGAQARSVRALQAELNNTNGKTEEDIEKIRKELGRNLFVRWFRRVFVLKAAMVEQKQTSRALLTKQANTLRETNESFNEMYQFLRQVRKWLLQVEMDLGTVERHLLSFDCPENQHIFTTRADTIKGLLTTLSSEFFTWIDGVDSLKVDCPGDLLHHFDEPAVEGSAVMSGSALSLFWPFSA